MNRLLVLIPLCLSSTALAGSMQLRHQGRLLDASGAPINGTHSVAFTVLDGANTSLFTETYATLAVTDGYYAVDLGSSAALDTSVFLAHGATSLRIAVDGVTVGTNALGGYPATVAHTTVVDAKLDALQELIAPTTCPADMTLVNPAGSESAFCIDNVRSGGAQYQPAQQACGALGRHVCTQVQWYDAATTIGPAGWCGAGSEWTSTIGRRGNSNGDLRLNVGSSADCQDYLWSWTGFGGNVSPALPYHCCTGAVSASFR